jgi:hypothetical protein
LNGIPEMAIKHGRGLRPGDPLSPMLFILAMDTLQRLLDHSTQAGNLTPIGADFIRIHTSLYADDAALFIRPTVRDINNVSNLVRIFGSATRLMTNLQKSELYFIHCEESCQIEIRNAFSGQVGEFSVKYLGLPLHVGRTRREDE